MRTRHLGLVLVALAAACGPSSRDVFEEYSEKFAAMRETLREIHGALPPAGGPAAPGGLTGLDPRPAYDEAAKTGNTEIVMDWQLLEPGASKGERMDLLLGGRLLTYAEWAGPDTPMSDRMAASSADGSFRGELEGALQTRYLVVVRTAAYDAPRVDLEREEYYGGSATMEVFLFDLPEEKLLGSIRFEAVAKGDIEYRYTEGGEDREERAGAWARSRIWETAREMVCDRLARETGGTFQLE